MPELSTYMKQYKVVDKPMSDKAELLQELIDKHNNGTCNCNVDNMELCIGGQYINGLITLEEVFAEWD